MTIHERIVRKKFWSEARCSIQLSYGCVPPYLTEFAGDSPKKPGHFPGNPSSLESPEIPPFSSLALWEICGEEKARNRPTYSVGLSTLAHKPRGSGCSKQSRSTSAAGQPVSAEARHV